MPAVCMRRDVGVQQTRRQPSTLSDLPAIVSAHARSSADDGAATALNSAVELLPLGCRVVRAVMAGTAFALGGASRGEFVSRAGTAG